MPAAARPRTTSSKPRTPRPPTAAQLAARKQREYEREQARKYREYEAARKRANREYEAMRKKRDREYAAAAKKRQREDTARRKAREREETKGGRREYAALAKAKPYEAWKYNGKPAPQLRGITRREVNITSDSRGATKVRGRLPKAEDTPQMIRDRAARNELRVRELRGIAHDLELDVRQAELEYKATAPGSKARATKKAKYDRVRERYARAWKAYEAAFEKARAGSSGRRKSA